MPACSLYRVQEFILRHDFHGGRVQRGTHPRDADVEDSVLLVALGQEEVSCGGITTRFMRSLLEQDHGMSLASRTAEPFSDDLHHVIVWGEHDLFDRPHEGVAEIVHLNGTANEALCLIDELLPLLSEWFFICVIHGSSPRKNWVARELAPERLTRAGRHHRLT